MADIKFIDGMRVSLPRQGAPKWIKFNISFKVDELVKFLTKNQNERGWVNIDVKKSKSGNLYACLNEYKNDNKKVKEEVVVDEDDANEELNKVEDVNEEELPF